MIYCLYNKVSGRSENLMGKSLIQGLLMEKVSIIPGRSRVLDFEKKTSLIETFSKYPNQDV